MRGEVGTRGGTGRLERRCQGDGGCALAVGADYLRYAQRALRVSEEREQGLDALEAEGDAEAAVEFVADAREGVVSGEGTSPRDTLRAAG